MKFSQILFCIFPKSCNSVLGRFRSKDALHKKIIKWLTVWRPAFPETVQNWVHLNWKSELDK